MATFLQGLLRLGVFPWPHRGTGELAVPAAGGAPVSLQRLFQLWGLSSAGDSGEAGKVPGLWDNRWLCSEERSAPGP